ncbi:hypothetical protein MNBD_CPR01-226 [hydrothermal vent metagenome]|uniref:Uncharacterized protein n=1 Tax=hydrothermal vent metagenome TaxID=652676 RepID=A0A3B0V661_9ZZZZ
MKKYKKLFKLNPEEFKFVTKKISIDGQGLLDFLNAGCDNARNSRNKNRKPRDEISSEKDLSKEGAEVLRMFQRN